MSIQELPNLGDVLTVRAEGSDPRRVIVCNTITAEAPISTTIYAFGDEMDIRPFSIKDVETNHGSAFGTDLWAQTKTPSFTDDELRLIRMALTADESFDIGSIEVVLNKINQKLEIRELKKPHTNV